MRTHDTDDAALANVQVELRVIVADAEWCGPVEIRLTADTYAGGEEAPGVLNLEDDIRGAAERMIQDAAIALEPHAARIMWGPDA